MIPGSEYPLEEGMASYSSILARQMPWTGAWWAIVSPWGHKESDMIETAEQTYHSLFIHKLMDTRLLPPLDYCE